MLNPSFSKLLTDYDEKNYVLGDDLVKKTLSANSDFDTGKEYRLQEIFGYEILKKLEMHGLNDSSWNEKKILDICCGTRFLSYHLLSKIDPANMVLIDISSNEVIQAKNLLNQSFPNSCISYLIGDAAVTSFKNNTFDIIIGNSFLHHFYNVPKAIAELKRILKPGGALIILHEPTIAAVALETGSLSLFLKYLFFGDKYIDKIRFIGEGIAPGRGQDVWIFNKEKVCKVLTNAGLNDLSLQNFHLFRSLLMGKFALHLDEKKPYLTKTEIFLIKTCFNIDATISKIVPSQFWGSISIKGTK